MSIKYFIIKSILYHRMLLQFEHLSPSQLLSEFSLSPNGRNRRAPAHLMPFGLNENSLIAYIPVYNDEKKEY